jgi:hypothetical protein
MLMSYFMIDKMKDLDYIICKTYAINKGRL